METTFFADPCRTTPQALNEKIELANNNPVVNGLLNTVSGLLAVLDENRQLVAFNDSFFKMLGVDDAEKVLGLRPGEAMNCVYCDKAPSGCGTGKYCATCGAAISIVSSLESNKPVEKICALTVNRNNETVDLSLSVRSHPIEVEDKRFLLIFISDITRQQERAALERVFYHDISNFVSVIINSSELLTMEEDSELADLIFKASLRLSKEIAIQRTLSKSMAHSYTPEWTETDLLTLIDDLEEFTKGHSAAKNKIVEVDRNFENIGFITDISLFQRVVTNMVVNALESTPEQGKICIWADQGDSNVMISVWNSGFIPEKIAMRVFQRNFSTKNQDGRGTGTFSMKHFGEKILGGKVGFTTSERDGTVFRFIHPVKKTF